MLSHHVISLGEITLPILLKLPQTSEVYFADAVNTLTQAATVSIKEPHLALYLGFGFHIGYVSVQLLCHFWSGWNLF